MYMSYALIFQQKKPVGLIVKYNKSNVTQIALPH